MDVSTPLPNIFFNRGAEKQPDTPRHISKEKKTRMQINPTTYEEIA